MANIIVSASTTNINVDTTTSTVDVSSTISNVLVGETTFVANNIVRAAISVTDTGGDGSLSYDEPTGVITYTGPNQTEANARIAAAPSQVRAHIANTAPILYNTTTGVISIDETAIFSGKTTDDLAQGTTNIYFSTSGATVDTDALPQGNTSQNRYLSVDDYGPSQLLMTNFLDVTDGRSTSGITANTDGAVYEVQQPGVALDGGVGFNFTSKSVGQHDESTALGTNFTGQQNIYIGSGANFAKRQTWYRDGSGNLQKTAAPLTVQSSVVDGINILNQKEPTFGTMAGLGLGFLNNAGFGTQGATTDSAFLTFPATNMAGGANSIYHGTLSITNTGSATLAPRTDNPHIHLTTVGENKSSADAANLRVSIGTTSTDSTNMLNVNGTSKFTGDMGVTGNINVTGNVEVDGNLNYRNVEDLYVRDQSITLNANATTNATVEIIGNRPQSTYQSILRWNETTDKWQFSNGNNSFKDMIDDVEAKTLLSTTTASSSGEGALSYDNTSGVFTFTPADLSDKIALTDLSVTTLTPSGDGALSYDNTSGVFTFTPADADEAPVYSVNREVGVVQLGTNLIPEGNVIGYDITTSSYVTGKLINSQLALPRGMTFNNDGTKMYVVGQEDSAPADEYVFEYVLTRPFDVTTITYSQSFSVETETNSATDIKFNTDGTKMFIGSSDGSTTQGVFEYDLSTGFNISTASYSQNFDASSQETLVSSIAFNSDGTKMFIVGLIQDTVFEYTLSTGFDLSTASYSTNSFDVGSQADGPKGLQFNGDGKEMYVADADISAATNEVYKYTLTTGFDITTASYSGTSFDFTPQLGVGQAQDLAFNSNGTKMYILDYNSATPYVQEYNLDLDSDGTGPLYYTQGRFDTAFAAKSTTDLSEGTNLYYTDARSRAALSTTTASASGGGALAYDNGTGVFTFTPADLSTVDQAKTVIKTVIAGEDLAKGDAVYISGGTGDNPEVSKADADDATKMPVFGVTTEAVTATNTTDIVIYGLLQSYNTIGFATGDSLFVSTTPGALTTTKPTGESALLQTVGKVIKGNSNGGKITITGAGRTNATPNLDQGNIFLGSSSDTAITVTPDSNFDTTGNAFSLSNALTDVNSITTESSSGFAINSGDGTTVTSKFGVNSTVTETANIAGKGYGVFNFTTSSSTAIAYSGTDSFEWYEIDGSVTSGSTTLTITNVVRGIDSTTAAVSDIIVGQVIANGTNLIIFPDDAYVVSVDSGAGTVEMSQPATQTSTFTHSADGIILDAGLVDTTTGLVVTLQSDLRDGGGSASALAKRFFRNTPFGYPASGPEPTDFDIITTGTASDYTTTLTPFMMGQTPVTNSTTALNAPLGVTIGENTQLTNRGENDQFQSFGMNMMWDGLTSYSRNIQPQVLFKSYTDNTEQSSTLIKAGGGPRLFFTSAEGNSDDNAFDTYPRANQELGRLSFWGTNGELLTPSSYNVPAFISVGAADDWDTWGGGTAGNTNVYMGATSDGLNADTYLSYKGGELILGSNSSKPITFAPAYNGSARDPDDAYTGNFRSWANVNYSNTGAEKGSKLTVTNGTIDGAGVVGDMEIGVFRNDITNGGSNVTVANNYYSTANNYYTSLSINAGPSLLFGAVFGTNVDLAGLNDGDQATFDNYTGTLGTEINGNSYYVKVIPNTGGSPLQNPLYANYAIGLYDDAALTTPTTLTSSTGVYSNAGTIEYTQPPSVTDREYKFKLEEQSEKLQFVTVDATPTSTTLIEYSEAITDFKNRVKLKSHTSADILALTGMTAGEMVYNSTDNLVAYYDGTDWRNIAQGAIIT